MLLRRFFLGVCVALLVFTVPATAQVADGFDIRIMGAIQSDLGLLTIAAGKQSAIEFELAAPDAVVAVFAAPALGLGVPDLAGVVLLDLRIMDGAAAYRLPFVVPDVDGTFVLKAFQIAHDALIQSDVATVQLVRGHH